MRKDGSLEKLRRKLLLQGLPRGYVNRTVREFAEHRDDLETQARAEGLSEDTARIAAEQSLGDTEALAEAILKTNQRCYWWGRHPVVSFGLLPLPLIVCLFLGSVVLMFMATGLFDWSEHKGALPEPNWTVISFWYYCHRLRRQRSRLLRAARSARRREPATR